MPREELTAAGLRAYEAWESQEDATKQAQLETAGSAWSAWWMARRCRRGRQRASDICFAENGGNGNGNGNDRDGLRASQVARVSRLSTRSLPVQTVAMVAGGTPAAAPPAAPENWYQSPWVWAAGAGAAYLLWMRK